MVRSLTHYLVVLFILTGTMIVTGATKAEEHAVAGPADHLGSMKVQPMTEDRFWALIGPTAALESDPERQLSALRASLEKLSIEDIEAYEATFDELMKRSYSWDLWGGGLCGTRRCF